MAMLLLAACAGVAPRTPPEPASDPVPAPMSYASALGLVRARQLSDDSVVVAGGRTILMTHGARTSRAYVLLHGFTDAPTQFQTVGEHLFADGANVYIPRLPHHAERVAPLRAIGRVRSAELEAFGDSVGQIARGLGDSVIVVGLSAGGVITGWIAHMQPGITRAVLIAPAIAPGVVSDDQALGIVVLASKLPDVGRMTAPIDSGRPENIPGVSSRGLAQLLQFGRRVHDISAEHAPATRQIVFLLNARDRTVSAAASLDLAQRWFDHGALVSAYRFDANARLPHNIMELTSHGGNTDIAYPVVEALARGVEPPTVHLLSVPCGGWRCTMRRGLGMPPR